MSESLIPQTTVQILPAEIPHAVFVKKVLPFLGGVLAKEDLIRLLQYSLTEFLDRFDAGNRVSWLYTNRFQWPTPHRNSFGYPINDKPYEYIPNWSILCYTITNERNPDHDHKYIYTFTASDYLRYWIMQCDISLRQLALIPTETLVLYIQSHLPSPVVIPYNRRGHMVH
jgi:hypothetical protein